MNAESDGPSESRAQPGRFHTRRQTARVVLWSALAVVLLIGVAVLLIVAENGAVKPRSSPPVADSRSAVSSVADSGISGRYRVTNGTTDSEGNPTTAARVCIGSGAAERCYNPPKKDPPFGLDAKAQEVKVDKGSTLILFSAESSSGGSGGLVTLALLDDRNGQLKNLLSNDVTVTNLSEYRLWSAPNVSAMPILVTADFIWAEGESHYDDSHRYRVTSYGYEQQAGRYSQRDQYVTATKYEGEVLEPEKSTILERLRCTTASADSPCDLLDGYHVGMSLDDFQAYYTKKFSLPPSCRPTSFPSGYRCAGCITCKGQMTIADVSADMTFLFGPLGREEESSSASDAKLFGLGGNFDPDKFQAVKHAFIEQFGKPDIDAKCDDPSLFRQHDA